MSPASKKAAVTPASKSTLEVWGLKQCGTTRKALKFLESKKLSYVFHDIRETAPPKTVLNEALKSVAHHKKAFNTSGAAYKDGNWKEKVDSLTRNQVIAALSANPMLIKRPVVRAGSGVTIGFDEDGLSKAVK